MKLINDKKFLDEIGRRYLFDDGVYNISSEFMEELLSKHLRDLPKKKRITVSPLAKTKFYWDEDKGYNQCLKDCEEK